MPHRGVSLRLSFTAGWRHWDVRNRVWVGGWGAQQQSSTPPLSCLSIAPRQALHPPSYLATWHLAQFRCLATGACNHNTGLLVAHPPALVPPFSVSLISFFTPEKPVLLLLLYLIILLLLLLYFIWHLTLHKPLYWSTDYQHILFFSSIFLDLYRSPYSNISNHA